MSNTVLEVRIDARLVERASRATGVAVACGLRISSGPEDEWHVLSVPARAVNMVGEGHVTYDGTLDIEMRRGPDVVERDGYWIFRVDTTYEAVYRVHNRTGTRQRVRVRADAPRSEREITIAAGDSADVEIHFRASEPGPCFRCAVVGVASAGAAMRTDEVYYPVLVVP